MIIFMIVILGIPLLSLCITLISEFTISRKYKNIHNCYYWKPRTDESSLRHLKLTNTFLYDERRSRKCRKFHKY